MGAYQIWHIEFKDKKSRDKFEKIRKVRRLFQYTDEGLYYDCTYYIGWEGYAEGAEFLNKYKSKLKIIKFESLDLSTQSRWYDELLEKVKQNSN